jgi:hypothetical protein
MAIAWTRYTNKPKSVFGVTTALTESAPTDPTDGIDLRGVDSIAVSIAAPNGQTFDGTGALLAYRYHDDIGAWRPMPEFDYDMSDALNRASVEWASISVNQKDGRIAYVPSGVGVSGGTVLTISIIASGGPLPL